MSSTGTLKAWLVLRATKGLGEEGFCRLLRTFGSPDAILQTPAHRLAQEGGVKESVANAIQGGPDPHLLEGIHAELEQVEKGTFSVVTLLDKAYPSRLKMIPDPPPLLYVTGTLKEDDEQALAIVGARNASPGGVAFTEELSCNLAFLGFTIISGMARGVDTAAHRGALKASGRTVAVLGCGIDQTYPPEQKSLRKEIEANGAVVSEFPTGTPPRAYHFPRRNRMISGLALGVVVTEAALKSGSLITARCALEQNREVFVVPGTVKGNRHGGPHHLIKQGAKLIEGPEDIIEELLPQLNPAFRDRLLHAALDRPEAMPDLTVEENTVFQVLSHEPVAIDDVTTQAGFRPAEVMSILLSLELKGLIRQLPGSQYVRNAGR